MSNGAESALRNLGVALIVVAAISIVVGIIARLAGILILTFTPLAFLEFTAICLLFAIALMLLALVLRKS